MTTRTLKIDILILPHDAWTNAILFTIEKTSIYHQVITVITLFLSHKISFRHKTDQPVNELNRYTNFSTWTRGPYERGFKICFLLYSNKVKFRNTLKSK